MKGDKMNHWQIGEKTSQNWKVCITNIASNRNSGSKQNSRKIKHRRKDRVRNCELWIIPYFQAKTLACHGFMNAGRRHRSPGSEIKAFDAHGTASSMSILFASFLLFPKSYRVTQMGSDGSLLMKNLRSSNPYLL